MASSAIRTEVEIWWCHYQNIIVIFAKLSTFLAKKAQERHSLEESLNFQWGSKYPCPMRHQIILKTNISIYPLNNVTDCLDALNRGQMFSIRLAQFFWAKSSLSLKNLDGQVWLTIFNSAHLPAIKELDLYLSDNWKQIVVSHFIKSSTLVISFWVPGQPQQRIIWTTQSWKKHREHFSEPNSDLFLPRKLK